MLNKYLTMNPIPWLTDGENPAVTYLVKNEILKQTDPEKNYNELLSSNLTDYFNSNLSKGILGDINRLDLYNHGPVWFFLFAVESGYKNSGNFIASTADYLCGKIQLDDGGFKFSNSDAAGCRTGDMTYSLLKCGIKDSRSLNGIKWIIKNQRDDGGWLHCSNGGFCNVLKLILLNKSGDGLKYESDSKIPSCPVASYTCLKALIQSGQSNSSSINRGIEFFLRYKFFAKKNQKVLCGNKVSFEKLGYPVMSQYDFLSGMALISKVERYNSEFGELFNSIIRKQNHDGTWNCENRSPGMINEKPMKSRWVTLNALRLINSISLQEDQLKKA
ncbi:MAG: hypothetical protein FWG49_05965 [Leptospirales bacterium]|nr:hypothetical protein [Leptospirales bacterium]